MANGQYILDLQTAVEYLLTHGGGGGVSVSPPLNESGSNITLRNNIGGTITLISTDGTFADDSDTEIPTQKAVETYVLGVIPSPPAPLSFNAPLEEAGSTIDLKNNAGSPAEVTEIDIDGTLAGDSDTRIATQKAVKTYVDDHVISGAQKICFYNQGTTPQSIPSLAQTDFNMPLSEDVVLTSEFTHNSGTPYKLTCNTTGLYLVDANLIWSILVTTEDIGEEILGNQDSTPIYDKSMGISWTGAPTESIISVDAFDTITINAGDTIGITVSQEDSGSNPTGVQGKVKITRLA